MDKLYLPGLLVAVGIAISILNKATHAMKPEKENIHMTKVAATKVAAAENLKSHESPDH
ncbi:MAG: hypothetical protein HC819_14360 [Cyclobacteriaceae bacterium]|nr:hypothetical protein [Cyclobacteriaceae bacterium]